MKIIIQIGSTLFSLIAIPLAIIWFIALLPFFVRPQLKWWGFSIISGENLFFKKQLSNLKNGNPWHEMTWTQKRASRNRDSLGNAAIEDKATRIRMDQSEKLRKAITTLDKPLCEELLKKRADLIADLDGCGSTPLLHFISTVNALNHKNKGDDWVNKHPEAYIDLAKFLFNKCPPSELGKALTLSSYFGLLPLARLLLDCGATINFMNDDLCPLLSACCRSEQHINGPLLMPLLLLDRGADVNCRGAHTPKGLSAAHDKNTGKTALHFLSNNNENSMSMIGKELARDAQLFIVTHRLFEAGIDLDAIDFYGDTALHLAVSNRSGVMVNALLDCRANPNVKNGNGLNAYELSQNDNHPAGLSPLLKQAFARLKVEVECKQLQEHLPLPSNGGDEGQSSTTKRL